MKGKHIVLFVLLTTAIVAMAAIPPMPQLSRIAQNGDYLIVGRNVNMVSGLKLPDGDPYLQRQNEPSVAVSTRNPMHLLAGANDYRTIDLPFQDKFIEEIPGYEIGPEDRDAWVGAYMSYDGGQSWISKLLPGFPQDGSNEGLMSPLKGFGTAADPVIRAGTNGIFYYAGIAYNRVDRGAGVIFVARYIDDNNQENGQTIRYESTSIVDQGNAGQFLDKPWLAVDIPREFSGPAMISGQAETIPCGNVYIAYSAFMGNNDKNVRSKMLFSRSTDCGLTWSNPVKLDESSKIDQGAVIAIAPTDGTIYVAWRRFTHPSQPSAILIAKSTDFGMSFTKATEVKTLGLSFPASNSGPFDQATTSYTFRTNSYPALAVDDNGIVYLALAERNGSLESRIVMSYSYNGLTWNNPFIPIDESGDGQQVKPTLNFAGGRLMLSWVDQRNDLALVATAGNNPEFIEDSYGNFRHTMDIRTAQIEPVVVNGGSSNFGSSSFTVHDSKQVSRYLHSLEDDGMGGFSLKQLQYNFFNLPLFQKGTVPFMGDYIDSAPAPMFLPPESMAASNGNGWTYNTDPNQSTVNYVVWTDTRDIRFPPGAGGGANLWPNWGLYKAPNSTQPHLHFPNKTDCFNTNYAGMMNQNVYISCISQGFVAGSPGNTKPLYLTGDPDDTNDHPIARAFVVTVKNMTAVDKAYTLTIQAPSGVDASFVQYFEVPPGDIYPVLDLYVEVAAHSSASVPVFIYPNSDTTATVNVLVTELSTALTSLIFINPDSTAPEIINPEDWPAGNPNIRGAEVHAPNIRGISISTQDYDYDNFFQNLDDEDLEDVNADTASNPNIRGPNIRGNPLNPNIRGPNIRGYALSEISWEVDNDGNTTTPYYFAVGTDYNPPDPDDVAPEEAMYFHLLIYRVYTTPTAENCNLSEEEHHELVVSISNPNIRGPNIRGTAPQSRRRMSQLAVGDVDVKDPTFWLEPGGKALVKLWAIDPVTGNGDDFTFGDTGPIPEDADTQAMVISQAHNTEDLEQGIYKLPAKGSTELKIMTLSLDDATVGTGYNEQIVVIGDNPPFTWSVVQNPDYYIPPGLSLDADTGIISGIPDSEPHRVYPLTYEFLVRVEDSGGSNPVEQLFSITVASIPGPILNYPDNGEPLMDNGCLPPTTEQFLWDFYWDEMEEATEYHFYLNHSGPNPFTIDDEYILDSEFHYISALGDYIADTDLDNWTWKVRARIDGMYWTGWSEERTFSVEPVDSDCPIQIPHEITTPYTPVGTPTGAINVSYVYTSGGAVCSQGHDVQYRFYWGDGTDSGWLSLPEATKIWTVTNTDPQNPYEVTVIARCTVDNNIESVLSNEKDVWIFDEVHTVNGTILWNGSPITDQPEAVGQDARFWARSQGINYTPVSTYNNTNSAFTLQNIPTGVTTLTVRVDAVAPFNWITLAGDYDIGGVGFTAPVAQPVQVNIQRTIHLVEPIDNVQTHPWPAFATLAEYNSPIVFEWVDIPEATHYEIHIDIFSADPFQQVGDAYDNNNVTGTSISIPLAASEPNQMYLFYIYAYNGTERIGKYMMAGTYWYGWDYRFRIQ